MIVNYLSTKFHCNISNLKRPAPISLGHSIDLGWAQCRAPSLTTSDRDETNVIRQSTKNYPNPLYTYPPYIYSPLLRISFPESPCILTGFARIILSILGWRLRNLYTCIQISKRSTILTPVLEYRYRFVFELYLIPCIFAVEKAKMKFSGRSPEIHFFNIWFSMSRMMRHGVSYIPKLS